MRFKPFLNLISIFSFFLWWGGFTFYATFVIPIGMKVLGDHVQMGFISQQVARQLNYTGLIAFMLLLLNEFVRAGRNFKCIPLFAKAYNSILLALLLSLFIL